MHIEAPLGSARCLDGMQPIARLVFRPTRITRAGRFARSTLPERAFTTPRSLIVFLFSLNREYGRAYDRYSGVAVIGRSGTMARSPKLGGL